MPLVTVDNCTRPDSLPGSPGGGWIDPSGNTWQILNNRLVPNPNQDSNTNPLYRPNEFADGKWRQLVDLNESISNHVTGFSRMKGAGYVGIFYGFFEGLGVRVNNENNTNGGIKNIIAPSSFQLPSNKKVWFEIETVGDVGTVRIFAENGTDLVAETSYTGINEFVPSAGKWGITAGCPVQAVQFFDTSTTPQLAISGSPSIRKNGTYKFNVSVAGNLPAGTTTINLSATGGTGTFTPSTLAFGNGTTAGSVDFKPSSEGDFILSATANGVDTGNFSTKVKSAATAVAITAGDSNINSGYIPKLIQQGLRSFGANPSQIDLVKLGRDGTNSNQWRPVEDGGVSGYFDDIVDAIQRASGPAIVYILLGTNDSKGPASKAVYKAAITSMVNKLRSMVTQYPTLKVVLCRPFSPNNFTVPQNSEYTSQSVAAIPQYIQALGEIEALPVNANFLIPSTDVMLQTVNGDNTLLVDDRIHINNYPDALLAADPLIQAGAKAIGLVPGVGAVGNGNPGNGSPTLTAVYNPGTHSINISWTAISTISGYNLYKSLGTADGTPNKTQSQRPFAALASNVTRFNDTDLSYPPLNLGENMVRYYLTTFDALGLESNVVAISAIVTFLG